MGPRSTEHPNHVRIDLPLKGTKDNRDIGTLSLMRNLAWRLYDEEGKRMVNPELEDVVTITLTNPPSEQVTWLQIPARALFTELDET